METQAGRRAAIWRSPSITYTSFESVSTISENNYVASFTYNPEEQRAKMVFQQSGNKILTRWYSGSSYVKETAGGVTKQYTFIGGDAYTAPVVAIKAGTGIFTKGRRNPDFELYRIFLEPYASGCFNFSNASVRVDNAEYLNFFFCDPVNNKVRFKDNPPVYFRFSGQVATFREERSIMRQSFNKFPYLVFINNGLS